MKSIWYGGADPVKLSLEEGASPICEQVWDHLGPIVNSVVPKMKLLLSCFGVRPELISPICQGLDLVDLLEMYLSIVPKHLVGTAGKTEDGMEDGDEPSKKQSSGKAKSSENTLPPILEKIQFLHGETVS